MTDEIEKIAQDLFDGIIPDKEAWKIKDKRWMSERAKQWPQYEKRLLKADLKKNIVSKCKKYYLKGQLTPYEDEINVCMLLLVWFHPNKSDDNWDLIKRAIQEMGTKWNYARDHYKESVELYKTGQNDYFCEKDGFKSGFFMGEEINLWYFLFGVNAKILNIKFDGENEINKFLDIRYTFQGCIGMNHWLNNKNKKTINKFTIYACDCYLEYWYGSLSDDNLTQLFETHPRARRPNKLIDAFKDYLKVILTYETDTAPECFKSIYVQKVRKILNERPLSKSMQAIIKGVN